MTAAGDPRALDDAAIVPGAPAALLRVRGGDRVTFLHRLLSADVAGVPPGRGTRALLLDTKAHVVADFRVFVADDEVRLLVESGGGAAEVAAAAAAAGAALSRYAVMDDVAVTVDEDFQIARVHGPGAEARLAAAGVPAPLGFSALAPWAHAMVGGAAGPLWLVRARAWGADGIWVGGGRAAIAGVAAQLVAAGVATLAEATAEALRIEAGEPRAGAEIDQEHFPMEIGLAGAIDYGKGCFLGQEPIVRIRDRGHINWRLVRLRVAGDVAPAPGDRLEHDAREKAGRVTSAARLPDAPAAVALGLLHVSVPEGEAVRVRHGDAVLKAWVEAIDRDASSRTSLERLFRGTSP